LKIAFADFSAVYTILIDGARGPIVDEPLVVEQICLIQWQESRVDLSELARLRWIEEWTRKELSEHYGRTEDAIQNYFQKIKKKGIQPD
jgi:hypothetical protein